MSAVEIIGAAVAVLTPLGAGGAFIWGKVEARFVKIEAKLDECQAREDASLERMGVFRSVTEILWQELKRLSPRSSAGLIRARKLLDDIHELAGLDPGTAEPDGTSSPGALPPA